MVKIDMDAIRRLTVPERVRLMHEIWDSLSPSAETLPLTAEQKAIIDRRKAEHEADPDSAITLEELKARLTR